MYQASPKGNRVGSQVQAMIGMIFLYRVRKGISEKVIFGQKSERSEGMNILNGRNDKHKGSVRCQTTQGRAQRLV